jgi:hypothetical protein
VKADTKFSEASFNEYAFWLEAQDKKLGGLHFFCWLGDAGAREVLAGDNPFCVSHCFFFHKGVWFQEKSKTGLVYVFSLRSFIIQLEQQHLFNCFLSLFH